MQVLSENSRWLTGCGPLRLRSIVAASAVAALILCGPAQPSPSAAQPESAPGSRAQPQGPTQPAAAPAPAPQPETEPEVVLVLKDGRRVTGMLAGRTERELVLRIGEVEIRFASDQVAELTTLAPVMERYRQMRAAVADTDAEGLLLVAEWLRARGKYDAALVEVERVLSLQPGHAEAARLRDLVMNQRAQAERKAARAAPPNAGERRDAEDTRPDGRPRRPPFVPLLTEDQVNLIRVYEVDVNDPPKMTIDRQAIAELLEKYAGREPLPTSRAGREALFRLKPAQVLDLMFKLQARELYGRVRVMEDPASMEQFRNNVHRSWVINACASTRCHGGAEAGRLQLATRRPNSDATIYTNFLILDRFRLADGTPLIDYTHPIESPLLQMAVSKQESRRPHADVPLPGGAGNAFRAPFRSPDDRRIMQGVEWIRSMYRPRPEYNIEYPLPEAKRDEP